MLEQTHTSYNLANFLHRSGFLTPEYEYVYSLNHDNNIFFRKNGTKKKQVKSDMARSYDILNDLCVTHAKELFGEEMLKWTELSENKKFYQQFKMPFFANEMCEFVPMIVMQLIKQGRKEEAEQYIMDNCIL